MTAETPGSDGARSRALPGRVLVTGARGFLGRHLHRRLTGHGVEVWAVSRIAVEPRSPAEHWLQLDLVESAAVAQAVDQIRPDAIVHLAGDVHGGRDRSLALSMLDSNVRSAVNLMQAAAETGSSVVLAGSVEEPRRLDSVLGAHTPYAASKIAATAFATWFRDVVDLPVTVLRPSMIYGPDQPDRTKIVPYVITSLLAGRCPELGTGVRLVDWIYIDDVVDAFEAALGAGVGGVLDIGSGTGVPIREVAETLADLVDTPARPHYGVVPDRPGDRAFLADPAEAAVALDWQPRTFLADGLQRTVQWYRAAG